MISALFFDMRQSLRRGCDGSGHTSDERWRLWRCGLAYNETEDALTASLADLLEDLGDVRLLKELLSSLRPVAADGKPIAPVGAPPADFDAFEVCLWPNWKTWGIPDVALVLLKQGDVVCALAIEVKYEAGKSGADDPDDPELSDQLACTASKGGRRMARLLP